MGRIYNGTAGLPQQYKVSAYQPIDIREIVKEFNDLLSVDTFYEAVYEGMRVLVINECCVYELVSASEDESLKGSGVVDQFDTENTANNKKLWKRLTIETITTKEALKRAKDNLVNGALIYIANDVTEDGGNVVKSGFYYCESGKALKTVGGEVTAEQFTTLNNKVDVDDKVSTAIAEAIVNLVGTAHEDLNTLQELSEALQNNPDVIATLNEAIGTKANQSSLTELSAEVSRIYEVAGAASASIDDLEESLGDYTRKAKIDEAIATSKTEITEAYTQAINDAIGLVLETPL